jgi:hypothetical protein
MPLMGFEHGWFLWTGGMMDSGVARRVKNKGTVLVASTDTAFVATVGQLVLDCGFAPAFPAEFEGPWLSLTRTQPRVVICDYDAQVGLVHRLIVESSARRVPLVVFHSSERSAASPAFAPVARVTWLKLPVSSAALGRVLGDLVPPARHAA